jgi:hypothetical protein
MAGAPAPAAQAPPPAPAAGAVAPQNPTQPEPSPGKEARIRHHKEALPPAGLPSHSPPERSEPRAERRGKGHRAAEAKEGKIFPLHIHMLGASALTL